MGVDDQEKESDRDMVGSGGGSLSSSSSSSRLGSASPISSSVSTIGGMK